MPKWIPLMDYAIRNGVSLSTLRRHIKANKIEFQVQNGRYYLLDDSEAGGPTFPIQSSDTLPMPGLSLQEAREQSSQAGDRVAQLERDLRKAREEIAELKTLIAFYEEKIPQQRFSS